ncbi:MAG: hypothetical protein JSS06_00940 [Proteobacteria bacterium]|nr:hypothetical protein [Pseudomonadota bacterium]
MSEENVTVAVFFADSSRLNKPDSSPGALRVRYGRAVGEENSLTFIESCIKYNIRYA